MADEPTPNTWPPDIGGLQCRDLHVSIPRAGHIKHMTLTTSDGVTRYYGRSVAIRQGDRLQVRADELGHFSAVVTTPWRERLRRACQWEPSWLPYRGTAGRTRWQEAFYQWRIVGFWRWWRNHLSEK